MSNYEKFQCLAGTFLRLENPFICRVTYECIQRIPYKLWTTFSDKYGLSNFRHSLGLRKLPFINRVTSSSWLRIEVNLNVVIKSRLFNMIRITTVWALRWLLYNSTLSLCEPKFIFEQRHNLGGIQLFIPETGIVSKSQSSGMTTSNIFWQ